MSIAAFQIRRMRGSSSAGRGTYRRENSGTILASVLAVGNLQFFTIGRRQPFCRVIYIGAAVATRMILH